MLSKLTFSGTAIEPYELDQLSYCGGYRLALSQLLARYGLSVQWLDTDRDIPGSFWGAPEAGLIGDVLYVRADTPVHSALHEAGHYICMDQQRRLRLHTDAGGTEQEECAVNYLQILLADQIPGIGRHKLMQDMDRWGYSFRLGRTQLWFEQDADDARSWLIEQDLMDSSCRLNYRCRQ